jgi:TolB-like protein/Tfp pilus assembly protein PilF/predicted Ser/Thr protein kinase
MYLASGTRLGPYKIEAPIGAGGMGEVYRATDTRLSRDVAIKILSSRFTAEPDARLRFEREAHTASALNDPHICTIYDVGQHEGRQFLVMELLEGRTLKQYMDGQSLAVEQVLKLGMQIAGALQTAHGKGIIHRDVKPANIFVTERGEVKVLDFGLAKLLPPTDQDATHSLTLTEPQAVLGTLPYMAPEQLRGEKTDARTDIWGVGAVLYEVATSQRPFREELSTRLTDAILHQPPTPPRALNGAIPTELERIILKCLDKDPENRYQSATELVVDLRRLSTPTSQSGGTLPAAKARVRRGSARQIAYAAVGVLVLAAAGVATNVGGCRERLLSREASPRIQSLAVLPLANLSHDPEQDYFADGMTEALIANLAQVSALRVISRTSVMHYKGTDKTLPQIARDLNVDAVIEGTVQRSGNRVQVTAQLIRGQTDAPEWAKIYERDSRDVLMMQSELAQAIVGEIKVHLTPQERQHLARARPINPDAYNAYLLGNYHSSKRSPAALAKGIEYFQEAIRIDPNYAQAYAGLASAYIERDIWAGLGIGKTADQIRAATLKALELDGELAEAHALLGEIHFQYDWDWPGTEAQYKRAIQLNPNLADTYVRYAFFLQAMRRDQEALAAVHRAVELDPLSASNICDEGRILYRARQFEKAIVRYQKALELDPGFLPALSRISEAYEELGKFDEALAAAQKLSQATDRRVGMRPLARIYARMGMRREAMEIVRTIEKEGSLGGNEFALAAIYSALGDRDHAMAALEKGVQSRSLLPFVFVDPQLDPLRSDPRFQQLLRRAGLPS